MKTTKCSAFKGMGNAWASGKRHSLRRQQRSGRGPVHTRHLHVPFWDQSLPFLWDSNHEAHCSQYLLSPLCEWLWVSYSNFLASVSPICVSEKAKVINTQKVLRRVPGTRYILSIPVLLLGTFSLLSTDPLLSQTNESETMSLSMGCFPGWPPRGPISVHRWWFSC